jgi:hypothetical protein
VPDFALDFLNTAQVEGGVSPQTLGRFGRHFTELGKGLGGGQLDFEPAFIFVLFRPNSAHFRARITRNHPLILEHFRLHAGLGDDQAREKRAAMERLHGGVTDQLRMIVVFADVAQN